MSGWKHQASRHDRGYGRAWQQLRQTVLERDRYLCQCAVCRSSNRVRLATEVDHIVPKARGGTDALSNLQAINADCHKLKTLADAGGSPPVRIGFDGFPVDG